MTEDAQPQGPRSSGPTYYQQWQAGEGIPSYTGSYVESLYTLEVAPWPRTGQKGAFVNLAAQELDDGQLLEIAPGGETEVLHHLYEALVYVLDGRGATTIWQKDGPKQTVEWQRGSLFSPPLNTYYQHFNLDGEKPARLYAATTAPATLNLLRDSTFVFDAPYVFSNRYNAEDGYFSNPGEQTAHGWKTNFVPDLRAFELTPRSADVNSGRGAGGSGMGFLMSDNACSVHISEFPPGTYKKAHRHGAGAHVIILGGEGYSMLHFEGKEDERIKADWKDGSIFSPQHWEYHQHFNTGPTPARYLACTFGRAVVVSQNAHADTNQIEYPDEDPAVYELYEAECLKRGAEIVLPRPAYAART
ncbi:MAG: ethanolamine ammonia lyase-activating protein [Chloroflexi bacterium]|nr:ethanolamine ammonia lyase-activating protein [Chloroflexota bacterium]